MTVDSFIQVKSRKAGYATIADLHRALLRRLPHLTYTAVHHWWNGRHRPTGQHALALAIVLELDDRARVQLHELPLPAAA